MSKGNKFIDKFRIMSFEEKKNEIMRLLKDLIEDSTRARILWEVIPDMKNTIENTEELIINYSDIIFAIEEVEIEEVEEKKKKIEEDIKIS